MTAAVAAALALVLSAPPAFTVVLDPGHGGEKEGALSPWGDREKDVVLSISRRIAQRLRKAGGKVVFTRTGDIFVPLPNRAAIATAIRADLFVSVHLNSMPTAEQRRHTEGIETYFLSADASDTHASAVAARENADRLAGEPEPDPDDPVAGILSDLQDADALVVKTADEAKYRTLFEQIKAEFNKAYVAGDTRIKGNTQTDYILALAFDLLPPEKRSAYTYFWSVGTSGRQFSRHSSLSVQS